MAEPPPEVLAGGRDEPQRSVPRPAVAVVLAVLLAGFAGVLLLRDDPAPAPSAPTVEAELAVVADRIQVTLEGRFVVPVSLSSPSTALIVKGAEVTAAPVRSAPLVVRAPEVVPRDRPRHLTVLLEPDCRVIGPGVGGELVATLVVRVAVASGEQQELQLSLGQDPSVRALLDGLCGGSGA